VLRNSSTFYVTGGSGTTAPSGGTPTPIIMPTQVAPPGSTWSVGGTPTGTSFSNSVTGYYLCMYRLLAYPQTGTGAGNVLTVELLDTTTVANTYPQSVTALTAPATGVTQNTSIQNSFVIAYPTANDVLELTVAVTGTDPVNWTIAEGTGANGTLTFLQIT
jgi:hypothetical protein